MTADTSSLADADGLGALSYEWKADGVTISGATGASYTLTQAEVGKAITVSVGYTDTGGTTETVDSAASAVVTSVNSAPTGGVALTGTATQGSVLTADTSSLADADGLGALSYEWKADGVTVSGATGASYTLTQAEVGKAITVSVGYTDTGGTTETVDSAASAVVTSVNSAPTGGVALTGTATQGSVLTADTSSLADADGLGALSYEWKADGVTVSGATGASYTLTQAEVGKAITVSVGYTDTGGTTETVDSAASAVVTSVNSAPTITSVAPTSVTKGNTYTYNVVAEDPDNGDNISLSVTNLPSWLTYDSVTHTISGTATGDSLGQSSFSVSATDGYFTTTQDVSVNVNNTISSLVILVDQFSDRIFDLGHNNITLFDFGYFDETRFVDFGYNGFYGYDTFVTLEADLLGGFHIVTPDNEPSNYSNFVTNTTNNFDYDYIQTGVGSDPYYGDYYYDDYFVLTRKDQVDDSIVNHGDYALEALLQQLDNPADTEIIAIDLDTLNGQTSHYQKLFDSVTFYDQYFGLYTGTQLEKIISQWLQLNDYRYTGDSKHDDYSMSAFSISIAGAPASTELATLDMLSYLNVPIVQSAPNVTQGDFDWGSNYPDVVNVGAWNEDLNSNLLISSENTFDTVDILADGIIVKEGWEANFGTSFATPRVAAEITNLINEIIADLESGGTSLLEAQQNIAQVEVDYTDIVASIVDNISTSVSFTITDEGISASYVKDVLSDDIAVNINPSTVGQQINEEIAWGVITEIEIV